jgi:hypothetical protein
MNETSNYEWHLKRAEAGVYSWDHIQVSLLMDIRDELRSLNQRLNVLGCPNFLQIPRKLDCIKRNTAKRKRRR